LVQGQAIWVKYAIRNYAPTLAITGNPGEDTRPPGLKGRQKETGQGNGSGAQSTNSLIDLQWGSPLRLLILGIEDEVRMDLCERMGHTVIFSGYGLLSRTFSADFSAAVYPGPAVASLSSTRAGM